MDDQRHRFRGIMAGQLIESQQTTTPIGRPGHAGAAQCTSESQLRIRLGS